MGWSPRSDGSVWQGARDIQVKEHSPALLLKMAWDNRRSLLWDIQQRRLMERHNTLGYQPGQQWVHQLVSDLVLTTYFVGRQVSLCAQLISGTAPTGEWLHGHGWKTDGRCACGQMATIDLRLRGCECRPPCPIRGVRSLSEFWALLELPP